MLRPPWHLQRRRPIRSVRRLSTNGIVGFKLASGNFGWIRLHVEDTDAAPFPDKLTAVDWAYDDTGAAIAVGARRG